MAEGRFDEALHILKNGAKTNKKQLPPDDELMEMLKAISADVRSFSLSLVQENFKISACLCTKSSSQFRNMRETLRRAEKAIIVELNNYIYTLQTFTVGLP